MIVEAVLILLLGGFLGGLETAGVGGRIGTIGMEAENVKGGLVGGWV